MTPETPLSELLRRHRAEAGLTQEELAEKAGVSARAISDLERGVDRKPYKVTMMRLADALGLTGEDRDAFISAARGSARPGAGLDALADVPERAGEATRGRVRRRVAPWWALAGLVGILALVVALTITRLAGGAGSHPASQPFSQTPAGLHDQQTIRVVLRQSDLAFRRSVGCACDQGLEGVKTGPDLQKYLQLIHEFRSLRERMIVTPHLFHVDSIDLPSGTIAYAKVSKDETSGIYRRGRLIQECSGPYGVRYHLVKIGQTWKVDDTLLLHGGQSCHTV